MAPRSKKPTGPTPVVAALLMSRSTVVVALNAQLLRRVDLVPDRVPADADQLTGTTTREADALA